MGTEDIKGTLFVVDGPSGAGKDTFVRKVVTRLDDVVLSPRYTTRAPRKVEEPGQDFIYVSQDEFNKLLPDFLFWHFPEYNPKNKYGTHNDILKILEHGKDVFMIIGDADFPHSHIHIYDDLKIISLGLSREARAYRLEKRGESPENIEKRLSTTKWPPYTYLPMDDKAEYEFLTDCSIAVLEFYAALVSGILLQRREKKIREALVGDHKLKAYLIKTMLDLSSFNSFLGGEVKHDDITDEMFISSLSDYDTCFFIGRLNLLMKNYSGAGSAFQVLLEKYPDDYDVLTRLAVCYRKQGDHEKAFSYAKKAYEVSSGKNMWVEGVFTYLPHMLAKEEILLNGWTENALVYLDQTLAIDDSFEQAHQFKFETLFNMGRYEAAFGVADKLFDLSPTELNLLKKVTAMHYSGREQEADAICDSFNVRFLIVDGEEGKPKEYAFAKKAK